MGTCFSAGDVSSGLLIFSAMQQEDDLKALENIVQQVDELFIRRMKGCTLRIRQSTVKQCVKHNDKLIFVQVVHNPVHKEFRWFAS